MMSIKSFSRILKKDFEGKIVHFHLTGIMVEGMGDLLESGKCLKQNQKSKSRKESWQ